MFLRIFMLAISLIFSTVAGAASPDFKFKEFLIGTLARQVPDILKQYDPETGRFGEGIWLSTDQNRMLAVAAAYAIPSENNPYFKDKQLLEVIMKAGDALIEDMDEKGRWEFRKKDGSTWGMIYMPWIYSRWIRSFGMIREDMPQDRRERWVKALTLGFTGISESQLQKVRNIPTHHAMGLFTAGKVLNRPEWCKQAAEFMMRVVEEQAEGGYWSEGSGPVVNYNFVYLDALGTYYAMSDDKRVLPALEKGAKFHWYFSYPTGECVETIDERNPYHAGVEQGNVGFTFTAMGRTYLKRQWIKYGLTQLSAEDIAAIRDKSQDAQGYEQQLLQSGMEDLSADLIASLLLYGEEGPIAEQESTDKYILTEGGVEKALTLRRGPWFVCLSAYTAPVPTSRWIQDRQNLVSIFHDKVGLILGGGNTKLQPAWSNFTVGDPSLLKHTPGDTEPDFLPKGELYHVPGKAVLIHRDALGLDLTYGPEQCSIRLDIKDPKVLEIRLESTQNSDLPVAAHLTLLPRPSEKSQIVLIEANMANLSRERSLKAGEELQTGSGKTVPLADTAIDLSANELGGMLTYAGYRLKLPQTASLHWPALPHNPYRKDGRAEPEEGRIEIRIPFDKDHREHSIILEIL
ncbi:MAG TPA: hypothetical protein PLQ35_09405 [bacterium]|nr:hypothetical protein [bacterium]HQL62498.1 hypothetical protein [bacterium]